MWPKYSDGLMCCIFMRMFVRVNCISLSVGLVSRHSETNDLK